MAFNGAGVFSRLYNWVNDKNASVNITASRMDGEMDGMATGLSNCLCKDGQQTATANQPMGGFRHTNVGNASSLTDYAAAGQVQNSALIALTTVGGTNTITGNAAITPAAYATNQRFHFVAAGTCTGAVTLNISALGAKAVQKNGAALVAGDITAGDVVAVVYDGTQFQMISPARTPVLTAGGVSGLAITNNTIPAAALLSTVVHDLTAKTTLTGADEIMISDSAASNAAKRITWTNFLATLITSKPITTRQYLTSGTAATYTTPANCKAILVKQWGGGGGGGASLTNAGSTGGTTTFNSVTAIGGSGGAQGVASGSPGNAGGAGGAGGTGGTFRMAGNPGENSPNGVGTGIGGSGGPTALGGRGRGASVGGTTGGAAIANSGSGGGGAVSSGSGLAGGGGGGAGEYVEIYIASPAANYTYTVGTSGAGGTAGTNAGGAGGTGMIIVEEYY